MTNNAGVSIRRVGFRAGTDEELRALHAVEVPVEVERGSSRMPRTLTDYMAFARNLPSQFSDRAWIVESSDRIPVGVGYCWSNSAGDNRVMECDVLVRRDWRRQGIGGRLMAQICQETVAAGRSLLTWSTWDSVPEADAFSRRVGAEVARVNRESELALDDVDWTMIRAWARGERARELGYSLEMVDGAYPEHLRGDAVTFHHIMNTQPRDQLDVGDVLIDTGFVAELDRALGGGGRTRWTVLVRDRNGTCVGGTEIMFESDDPAVVLQQNTGIDPIHRGNGLARWAKAAMLQRLRDERPEVRRVRTGNAYSNGPMLAINNSMGFKVVITRTDWQADPGYVLSLLG